LLNKKSGVIFKISTYVRKIAYNACQVLFAMANLEEQNSIGIRHAFGVLATFVDRSSK